MCTCYTEFHVKVPSRLWDFKLSSNLSRPEQDKNNVCSRGVIVTCLFGAFSFVVKKLRDKLWGGSTQENAHPAPNNNNVNAPNNQNQEADLWAA